MSLSRKTVPRPASFKCPQCGGSINLRHPERTMSVVCPYCQSILDTSTPQVHLVQQYANKIKLKPRIPLGARAKFRGIDSEVVGFMRRGGSIEGCDFHWDEYLLYNPFLGYRFLAETQTGWQVTGMTNEVPRPPADHPGEVVVGGRSHRLVESYTARVSFVLGEFYWQVSVGEAVRCIDYKNPPSMVMAEVTEEEYIWSSGTELPAAEVWTAFKLAGAPPAYSEPEDGGSLGQPSAGVVIAVIAIIVIIVILSASDGCGGSSGSGGFFMGGK